MRSRIYLALLTALLIVVVAADAKSKHKDKHKIILPDYVLNARTVLVVVSPEAQTSLLNPNENRTAREDVEKALMRWGRMTPVLGGQDADLVIAVRKGDNNRGLDPTVGGSPADDRPVILEPTDGAVRIGGQQGRPPNPIDPSSHPRGGPPALSRPIGNSEDVFEVYRGRTGTENPLDTVPVWRYKAKDALNSPAVPAVEQFKKIITQAEKEAQKPTKTTP